MKKFLILFAIIIIIISIIWFKYINYIQEYNTTQSLNAEFEKYYQKNIYGTELTTIINKAVDENSKNKVEKNEKNQFLDNNTNSINIDIKIIDTNKIYSMESFYMSGMEKFVQYYGSIKFKCTKIDHHKSTNKIKYLYFEQI